MTQTSQPIVVNIAVATGNTDSGRPYSGRIVGFVMASTGQPGTTVVTITTKGKTSAAYTLLVTAAGVPSGYYAPQSPAIKTTDGSAIAAWYVDMHVDDIINVAVASGAVGTVTVWMLYEHTG